MIKPMFSSSCQFVLQNKRSLSTFLIIGATAAAINFLVFGFCWKILKLHYPISISISYVFAVTFHFLANRHFTFRSSHVIFTQQLPKYLMMLLLNYFITLCIVHVTVELFHLSPYLGIVFSIGTTMWITYFISRWWVFHTKVKR